MSGGRRLFFALLPDPEVRRQVAALQRELDYAGRPVAADNLHVTLAFLGNQPAARVPELLALGAGLNFPNCGVKMDLLGAFPRAGVAWLGASGIPLELGAFRELLVAALDRENIAFDQKDWKFHLTLYRGLRKPRPIMHPVAVEWRLRGFDLIESVGTEKGVEYRSIGHWEGQPEGTVPGLA